MADAASKTPTAQDGVIHGNVETQFDNHPSRNGYYPHPPTVPVAGGRSAQGGWFSCALAHAETGLIIAVPLAPVIATFITVLMYIDPVAPSVWRDLTSRVPVILVIPGILLLVWLILALPLALLRLGAASRANSGSHGQLNNRLLSFESYRGQTGLRQNADEHSALDRQLDFVWKSLQSKGPKWVLGDGYISLWRQVDQMDSQLNYVLPAYRVWARAQGLLLRLPNPITTTPTAPDLRGQLATAMQLLTDDTAADKASETRGRGLVAQVQILVDSGRTDRYSGLLRARNIMLTACTMTSIAVYALFWLGIVALPATASSQAILGASLFFTTVGALVGLFQLLYAESQADTGVDDYGLSLARIVVAPQLAGLAALVGVVLTSLTTSTLSGSPATPVVTSSIPAALDQIRNPANVLVAVAFGLSPGLVFSRFRQNVEQTKRELTRTSGATSVQSKRGI